MKNSDNSFTYRIARRLMSTRLGRALASQLAASPITDNNFFPTGMSDNYRTRYDYDRLKVQEECLRAWRVNPLARRIVNLISQFVIGKGVSIETDHKGTKKFLDEWLNHPLNKIPGQLKSWKDEGTRTGNLFFLFSVDKLSGMSYLRAVPAELIKEI